MLRKALLTGLYAAIGAATTVADKLEEIGARTEAEAPPEPSYSAPWGPQLERSRAPQPERSGGMQPWVVLGAAFAGGYVLAKVLDWRAHGHPRS
jgi:hypothetical protein